MQDKVSFVVYLSLLDNTVKRTQWSHLWGEASRALGLMRRYPDQYKPLYVVRVRLKAAKA